MKETFKYFGYTRGGKYNRLHSLIQSLLAAACLLLIAIGDKI